MKTFILAALLARAAPQHTTKPGMLSAVARLPRMITSEIDTELRHNVQSREAQLTRTIIAVASALLAAMSLFASAAEACISCSYVPSVVHSPAKSHSEERSTPRREKRNTPRREKRTREVREPRENKRSRVTETAKSEKADKVQKTQKAEVEKVTPAASAAQVENSSVALVTTAHESVPAKRESPGDRGMEHSAFAGKRVALVIGNGAYQNVPTLPNPTRDADAIADLLRMKAGFDIVHVHNDLRAQDFMLALRAFKKVAEEADIALVFYAGHAIQLRETNYMVAVDATLDDEDDAQYWNQAIPLDLLLGAAGAKRLGVVILDACRDNPFIRKMRTRGVSPTKAGLALAPIKDEGAHGDTLIVYATAAGLVAADGDGEHSPFTEALLKHLAEPGLDVMRMFGKVRDEVRQKTGRAQIPHAYGTVGGDEIALVPAPAQTDVPGVTGQEDELLVQKVLRQFREERDAAKGTAAEQGLKAAEAQRKADAEQAAAAKGRAAAEAGP